MAKMGLDRQNGVSTYLTIFPSFADFAWEQIFPGDYSPVHAPVSRTGHNPIGDLPESVLDSLLAVHILRARINISRGVVLTTFGLDQIRRFFYCLCDEDDVTTASYSIQLPVSIVSQDGSAQTSSSQRRRQRWKSKARNRFHGILHSFIHVTHGILSGIS